MVLARRGALDDRDPPGPPWYERCSHACVVADGKIWLMGGTPVGTGTANWAERMDDVWSSADGRNWTRVGWSVIWSPRHGHTALLHNNALWVMGGYGDTDWSWFPLPVQSNDVWRGDIPRPTRCRVAWRRYE